MCPRISPQMKIVIESKSEVSQNTPKWKLSESPNPRCSRITPQNENCQRVQIQGVPEYSPPNENCHKIQIQGVPKYSPQMKIVIESKSEVSQNIPPNENCQGVKIQGVPEYPPKIKIVIESKSEVFQNTPQNENCQGVQIQGVPEYSPLKWKLSLDLESMTIFIWGEYSGTPWIWTLWQFSFGGILGHLRFGLSDNFHFGGGILGHLRFGLSDNFHFGGYSGTPWIWILWQFSF